MLRDERPFYRRALKVISRTERIEAGWGDGNGVQRALHLPPTTAAAVGCIASALGDWFLRGFFG